MMLLNHNNDQLGTKVLSVLQWHSHLGSNQQISNWTEDSLHKMKMMLETSQVPRASAFTYLGGESTTITLLKQNNP